MASTLQEMIGGKVAPLFGLRDEHMDIDTMITIYNTAVTDAAIDKLGRNVAGKSRASTETFSTSVMRRYLKKKRSEAKGAK